jgi:hypothetical protein
MQHCSSNMHALSWEPLGDGKFQVSFLLLALVKLANDHLDYIDDNAEKCVLMP